jgi:hypothetical protein
MGICKNSTREIAVQILQDGNMTLCARCSYPAICTAIKDVSIMEDRHLFAASSLNSE